MLFSEIHECTRVTTNKLLTGLPNHAITILKEKYMAIEKQL